MIAKDKEPLSKTEQPGFRRFCKTLQPNYKLPSEPTVTRKLEEKYQCLRDVVRQELAEADGITLTFDIWTHSSTMKSYLGAKCIIGKVGGNGFRPIYFYRKLYF